MKIYDNILQLVGNTPLVWLNHNSDEVVADIALKLEYFNPASSVKDRLALGLIEKAEKDGIIKSNLSTIIEPTSGNTGIGLAMVCAVKGYKLIITMPSNMSVERQKLIKAFGAEIVLTDCALGMQGSIDKAVELSKNIPNSFIPYQFKNPENPVVHEKTTAEEIWEQTDGKVDVIVAGVGTGGTLIGISKALKSKKSDLKAIAVEPSESAVLSGEDKGMHGIQGIGAGFIPEIVDFKYIDEIIKIDTEKAIETASKLPKTQGVLCGISAGAAVEAALEIGKRAEMKGKLIVVIIPDSGERYLSTELYREEEKC